MCDLQTMSPKSGGSVFMTFFVYKGLTRNPKIRNTLVWVLSNIWRMREWGKLGPVSMRKIVPPRWNVSPSPRWYEKYYQVYMRIMIAGLYEKRLFTEHNLSYLAYMQKHLNKCRLIYMQKHPIRRLIFYREIYLSEKVGINSAS